MTSAWLWGLNAAARVHHAPRRCGGGLAACCACAAAGMPVIGFLHAASAERPSVLALTSDDKP
jgi:hypothetical protein